MALKTYAFANEFNGDVSVSILDESDPEVQQGQIFKELQSNESKLPSRYKVENGTIVDFYYGKSDAEVLAQILAEQNVIVTEDLVLVKKNKITEIRSYFNAVVNRIKSDAAEYEVATWDVQRIEYAEWLKDNSVPIPYVQSLASARSMDVPTLMGKIGYRVGALANVQGMQHALESRVENATTIEEVQAVVMPDFG